MLDQNTTLLLSSAITVIGTLGGAIAGVVLTNRHNTKLEKLKIEQEKAKRDTEIIQEVYSLLMKINERAMNNISQREFPSDGLTAELGRVKALVHLFLSSAVSPIDSLLEAIDGLGISIMSTREEKPTTEEQKEISHAFRDYNTRLSASYNELEKLVR